MLTEEQILAKAKEKYPEDACMVGGCSGLKKKDKNEYERKIWIDGFRAGMEVSESSVD